VQAAIANSQAQGLPSLPADTVRQGLDSSRGSGGTVVNLPLVVQARKHNEIEQIILNFNKPGT